jgi:hypothetical protein
MQHDARTDNVFQSVTMSKPGRMYVAADIKSDVVRDLEPGTLLYPTGEKHEIYWKVSDELGNEGRVPSTLFELAALVRRKPSYKAKDEAGRSGRFENVTAVQRQSRGAHVTITAH